MGFLIIDRDRDNVFNLSKNATQETKNTKKPFFAKQLSKKANAEKK